MARLTTTTAVASSYISLHFLLPLLLSSSSLLPHQSSVLVRAQQLVNFTSIDPSQCVAPGAYQSCYDAVVQGTAKCVQETSNNPTAQKGCACVDGEEKINCFAEACWNRIYGCEYQTLVAGYLGLCSLPASDIPFWPAPDNVPGACSCNTGVAIETILAAETHLDTCLEGGIGNSQHIYECTCCAVSVGVSTLFDVCPNTNTTATLDAVLGAVSKAGFSWSECEPYLQDVDCVSGLGYQAPLSTGTIYNPTNTPAMGTQTLFDLPGEMTTPASGATFTWYAYNSGYDYTVTALSSVADVVTTAEPGGATATGGAGSGNSAAGAASSASAGSATGSSGSSGGSGSSGSSGGSAKSAAVGTKPRISLITGSLVMLGLYLFP